LFACQAIAALAALVFIYSLAKLFLVEIRPKHLGKVELGICKLPQQEVAQTLLLAGAYEQIGVGHE
jgi:hypothetical protein